MRAYLLVPAFLRRIVFRVLDRLPHAMKRHAGTVMVTSVGMFGSGAGWGIPVASHTLSLTIGGIVKRVGMVDGRLEERDHVCLTASFDHDIVDGAPAARYLHRLRRQIERAADLLNE
jgi:pyruvate/2-oxoglutarate dehydrogenase complex dihydrolipoamide acyltransferase (E2) component